VSVYPDPVRGGDDVLVMCEVLNPDSTPHATNTRAGLRELLTADVVAEVREREEREGVAVSAGWSGARAPAS